MLLHSLCWVSLSKLPVLSVLISPRLKGCCQHNAAKGSDLRSSPALSVIMVTKANHHDAAADVSVQPSVTNDEYFNC